MSRLVINVTGWNEDGPALSLTRRGTGWRGNRNAHSEIRNVEAVGSKHELPAYEVVPVNGAPHTVVFNRGHVYVAAVLIDAEVVEHFTIDATGRYGKLRLKDGFDLLDVATNAEHEEILALFDGDDKNSDNEDNDDEDVADEEE